MNVTEGRHWEPSSLPESTPQQYPEMKQILVPLVALVIGTLAYAQDADPVSVNFFVLEPGSGWGFENETIADNEASRFARLQHGAQLE
jgi:hypothetical protein